MIKSLITLHKYYNRGKLVQKQHDTIGTRLIVIISKLNQGEKLKVSELVEEFNVTARTIQRDIN